METVLNQKQQHTFSNNWKVLASQDTKKFFLISIDLKKFFSYNLFINESAFIENVG
jgi:hypothetical protein